VAAGAAACFWFGKVTCVAVDVEVHVTLHILDGGIGVCSGIVRQPDGGIVGFGAGYTSDGAFL
jgi:hypothetical protein